MATIDEINDLLTELIEDENTSKSLKEKLKKIIKEINFVIEE